jgi:putative phosphate ABC transporter, phosphate-binding component
MRKLLFPFFVLLLLVSCGTNPKKANSYLHEDDVKFAADVSFLPILQELSQLYGLRKPESVMLPLYCSEDSAIRLLLADSVRMAISTRPLNDNEKAIVEQHNLPLLQSKIAYDAFALIVNKENPDTVINVNELRKIVQGKITRWEQLEMGSKKGELSLVFDASGSSTVRYMKDSLNNGKDLKGNIFAQGSNLKVIQTIKDNPNAIGVVSTDWLRVHQGDTTTLQNFYGLDVRVMLVGKVGKAKADWQRPYQYYIATGEYPLVRSVWEITTDPRTRSTMRSFYFFLKENDGQRVINSSSQLLTRNQVQIKEVVIKD